MEDAVKEITLSGFDPEGEPVLRLTAAGRLWLGMSLFPPSWAEGEDAAEPWADFDRRLERAIGTAVRWEDREWFRIDQPAPDTVAAVERFLAGVVLQYRPADG